MKPWLVRLGLSLVLLGFAACSGSDTNKGPQEKPDPSVKPGQPPAPPPLPKNIPKDPNKR